MKVLLLLLVTGHVMTVVVLGAGGGHGIDVPVQLHCDILNPKARLTDRFHENIAHAIHSMTVQSLRLFNRRATAENSVPTVNLNVSAPNKVMPSAPDLPWGSDFHTVGMNRIDRILGVVGRSDDGLGQNWSPLERVVHNFHMWDLWLMIRQTYDERITFGQKPDHATCKCLLSTKHNGIYAAVEWVANHYKHGTPITLLNRPIPKLHNAATWSVWKDRLLHYYRPGALYDAAVYLHCVTQDM